MFKKMKDMCDLDQIIVSYFYRKKEFCPDCDAQSFVLGDIRRDMQKNEDYSLAIFSFDTDMELSSINVLVRYYDLNSYPCTVIEDKPQCGLYDKDAMIELLCESSNLTICKE